jgi:hypothetical protein
MQKQQDVAAGVGRTQIDLMADVGRRAHRVTHEPRLTARAMRDRLARAILAAAIHHDQFVRARLPANGFDGLSDDVMAASLSTGMMIETLCGTRQSTSSTASGAGVIDDTRIR